MLALNFTIGAQVHCTDGHWGQLTKVVTDPDGVQATDLIVERGMPLFKKARVLPISLVLRTSDHDIYLGITSDEMPNYPEFHETVIETPGDGGGTRTTYTGDGMTTTYAPAPTIRKRLREGISSGKQVLSRKTEVESGHKSLGHVDHVMVDAASGKITHLVMKQGLLAPRHRVIPLEMIDSIDEESILLSASPEAVAGLPEYEPRKDGDLLDAVVRHLGASSEYRNVHVGVENGGVRLRGTVLNQAARTHAERLARSVDGVVEVDNELVIAPEEAVPAAGPPPAAAAAEDLTVRVHNALAADPRTRQAVIEVICDRSTVTLQGTVADAGVRRAAEEVAREQPGVTTVINELGLSARVPA